MSLFQAFLCGICYYMSAGTWVVGVGFYTFGRALIQGFFVGLILGDPVTGTLVGCTIQLIYLGIMSTGGSFPADQALAGIMGTAAAITAGLSAEEAIAIAVPIGLLGTVLFNFRMITATAFVHMADKYAAEGNTKGIWYANVVFPQIALFLIYAIPCMLACYYGAPALAGIVDSLAGSNAIRVVGVIGGMLPVIGIAMNMKAIFKGEARLFFFVGFLMVIYLNFNMVAISLFALLMALVYVNLKGDRVERVLVVAEEDDDDE
ncbi:MAG TPA: PTS sugar transporter subunit IIC [Atopobiaceae bacterium]|nr:PTS sugar transporter subunit IIC [Atopobiaceae bacterium]